jgi:hypothetical protein
MTGVKPTDLADGLHPNDTGYQKMATQWSTALADAIERGWIQAALPAVSASCNGAAGPVWYPQGTIASGPGGSAPAGPGNLNLASDGGRVVLADLNGDSKADYLWAHADGYVTGWLDGGQGTTGVIWQPKGEVAGVSENAGVGDPGAQVQFADIDGGRQGRLPRCQPDVRCRHGVAQRRPGTVALDVVRGGHHRQRCR